MPTFIFDCPRCNIKKTTCDAHFTQAITNPTQQGNGRGTILATCRNCNGGLAIDVRGRTTPAGPNYLLMFGGGWWTATAVYPGYDKVGVSELLPDDVKLVMTEAEEALLGASPRIARGAFRTVLDVATKYVVSANETLRCAWEETRTKNLYNRIEFLAQRHILTPALQEWAHGVRGITNEDIHTVEPVTPTEAQEIAEITRMILTYLFEMPERVRLAKEAAKAKKQAASEKLLAPPAGQQ